MTDEIGPRSTPQSLHIQHRNKYFNFKILPKGQTFENVRKVFLLFLSICSKANCWKAKKATERRKPQTTVLMPNFHTLVEKNVSWLASFFLFKAESFFNSLLWHFLGQLQKTVVNIFCAQRQKQSTRFGNSWFESRHKQ